MSVLDRAALDDSPLADLHALASELSIDGYRRLRKPELIDAILARQAGDAGPGEAAPEPARAEPPSKTSSKTEPASPADDADGSEAAEEESGARRRPRSRRGGPRSRTGAPRGEDSPGEDADQDAEEPPKTRARAKPKPKPKATEETEETEETEDAQEAEGSPPAREEDELVEGVVELLPNGSGFVRVSPPDPSDGDVYISAAQIKRCELVSGDRISGPRRAPRRSERFASLVRVDSVNGRPAAEIGTGARYDDLPAGFPSERFRLASEDPTLTAIESLTPFGKGSRVTIVGAARAGKSEALRRLGLALAAQDGLQLSLALAGVRPEELSEWSAAGFTPGAEVSFAASSDAQDNAVELVIDQARRIATRGADAVVLIDTLDGLHTPAARKALAAARNIVDGGSLTVIATAAAPLGGETTVIALDVRLTSTGRFPALALGESGTIRPELLVGEGEAEAIARTRAEGLERASGGGQ